MKISIWLELKMVKGNIYSIPELRDYSSTKFWKEIIEDSKVWKCNNSSRNIQNVLKMNFWVLTSFGSQNIWSLFRIDTGTMFGFFNEKAETLLEKVDIL